MGYVGGQFLQGINQLQSFLHPYVTQLTYPVSKRDSSVGLVRVTHPSSLPIGTIELWSQVWYKAQYYVSLDLRRTGRASNDLASNSSPPMLLQMKSPSQKTSFIKWMKYKSCLSWLAYEITQKTQSYPHMSQWCLTLLIIQSFLPHSCLFILFPVQLPWGPVWPAVSSSPRMWI